MSMKKHWVMHWKPMRNRKVKVTMSSRRVIWFSERRDLSADSAVFLSIIFLLVLLICNVVIDGECLN